jgi:hypothetical protein
MLYFPLKPEAGVGRIEGDFTAAEFVRREVHHVTETTSWTILCPCCEATIIIDSQTGAIISHEEKAKPLASFEEMAKQMERQKQVRDQMFAQELGSMKDRERLLEEKFREAFKRAESEKDKPYVNPMDID